MGEPYDEKKTHVPSRKKITNMTIKQVINDVLYTELINENCICFKSDNRIREIERANKAIREEKEWN